MLTGNACGKGIIINFLMAVFFVFLFHSPSHAGDCNYINHNSSVEFSSKNEHCLTLPLYNDDPLVIIQYESIKSHDNKFEVSVLTSETNSSVLESFVSGGSMAINAASSTRQKAVATLRIRPVGIVGTSKIKVMFGNLGGLDTLTIYNENQRVGPPSDCIIPPGQEVCVRRNSGETQIPDFNPQYTALSSNMCNANNSSPPMPTVFDLNGSLKNAESFKSQLAAHINNISTYGDSFEKANTAAFETVLKLTWAFGLMNDGHSLDIKAHFGTGTQFEDFGNFHYGAFLKAAGFDRSVILSGASAHQAYRDNGSNWTEAAWPAFLAWFSQDKDHAHDTVQVERGIRYYDEVYKNESNPEQSSDSCDPNNGLNKNAGNSGGGGGGGGGSDGGSSRTCFYSAERWQVCTSGGCNYYYTNQRMICY